MVFECLFGLALAAGQPSVTAQSPPDIYGGAGICSVGDVSCKFKFAGDVGGAFAGALTASSSSAATVYDLPITETY